MLINVFVFVAPLILVFIFVLLKRKRIILSSSSFTIVAIMLSSWFLSIVSNTALMSIPEIFMMTSSFSVFAANHLWVQTTSAVLRSGRNPLFDRYSSTKGLILFKVMIDKALRNELSRVIGRKLFGGPFFLSGF